MKPVLLNLDAFMAATVTHLSQPAVVPANYPLTEPQIDRLKRDAKRLKKESGATYPTHAQALDKVAQEQGYRDWKTLMFINNHRKEK